MDSKNTTSQGVDNHPVLQPLQQQEQQQQQKLRKKCHGNRRDQRFRRKYRALNMKSIKIEKMLKKRNKLNTRKTNVRSTDKKTNNHANVSSPILTDRNTPIVLAPPTATTTPKRRTNLTKRKRDISLQDLKTHTTIMPKSTSSISIAAQHKIKKQKTTMLNTSIQHMNYRSVS